MKRVKNDKQLQVKENQIKLRSWFLETFNIHPNKIW